MKLTVIALLAMVAVGCSTPRVLVKKPTCKDAGPGLSNCEKVMDL